MRVLIALLCSAGVTIGCSAASEMANPDRAGMGTKDGTSQPQGCDVPKAEASAIELRLDRTEAVADLQIRWLELNDSRCPVGVTCPWGGVVTVSLGIRRNAADLGHIELSLRPGREPEAVSAGAHRLRLQSVDPYPRDGVTTAREDYRAHIELCAEP